jgi:sulfhydrogenase subunit beta (sulfur reductase)
MVKLPVTKLNDFFAAVAAGKSLFLPVDNSSGQADYQKWESGTTMSGALKTVRSAKDFFFPQTENIVDFKMDGKKIEVIDNRVEAEDFVLFGVRGCDAASFAILDSVYLAEPVDTLYKTRRDHGVIITLACTKPEATCFCPLFDIDATNPGGDIAAWIVGDQVFFRAETPKGKALLESIPDIFVQTSDEAVEAQRKETAKILERLPFAKTKIDKFKGENLLALFDSPEWASLSESCLGCGTCTYVCPTCQCYDIRDFDTGHGVKRFRCWDSCMYSDFTKMAHGNTRHTQVERFRQRFMHKLVYYPANNEGTYGCVGCGRCVSKCPVSLNIVKVMKTLGEDK